MRLTSYVLFLVSYFLSLTAYAGFLTSLLGFGGFAWLCLHITYFLLSSCVSLLTSYFLFVQLVFVCAASWRDRLCGINEDTVAHNMFFFSFYRAAVNASPRGSSRINRTALPAPSRRVGVVQGARRQWSCLETIAQRYLRPHAVSA